MQCQPSGSTPPEQWNGSTTRIPPIYFSVRGPSRNGESSRVHDWITLTVTGKYPRFEEEPFDLVRAGSKEISMQTRFFSYLESFHVVSNIFVNKCFRLNCWFGILTRTWYQFSEEDILNSQKSSMYKFRGIGRAEEVAWKGFRVFWPVTKAGGRRDIRPGSWKISSDLKRSKGSRVGSWERSWESLGSSIQLSTSLSLSIARSSWTLERNANPANPSSLWMPNIFFSVFKEFAYSNRAIIFIYSSLPCFLTNLFILQARMWRIFEEIGWNRFCKESSHEHVQIYYFWIRTCCFNRKQRLIDKVTWIEDRSCITFKWVYSWNVTCNTCNTRL